MHVLLWFLKILVFFLLFRAKLYKQLNVTKTRRSKWIENTDKEDANKPMLSHDKSDDSDYTTPKLVPYLRSDSSSDEMPTKTL